MVKRFHYVLCFLLLAVSVSLSAGKRPKNVILMIGDGMGIDQIYAGMVTNGNSLELERCKHVGFSKTYSSNKFVTDSGAGGTALATGVKTKNGMIGMSPDSVAVESVLHVAERNGLSTGVVSACAVTHATPASFVAHQVSRNMQMEIAADYLKTDIDVFIGGGRKFFEKRKDGRNLANELEAKNYKYVRSIEEAKLINSGKLAALVADNHPEKMPHRGNFLTDASLIAVDILDNNKKGFFMMVEASQIDWGGHANDTEMIINEMLDFDHAIGRILDYAEEEGNTLVIITADHETGGMTLPDGNIKQGEVKVKYSTDYHTGVPVPIFAFGPGAEEFTGFMENVDIKQKIQNLLKIK